MKIKEKFKKNSNLDRLYKLFRSCMWRLESKYYSTKDQSQREQIVAKQYKSISDKELDWDNLKTYNEKMQWYKMYDNSPIKTKLADKYRVREWVAQTIGEEYLIPLLGVWDKFEEIDFSKLPNKFVLKANHAAGTNIIVPDKSTLNKKEANILFNNWLKVNYAYFSSYQMQYEKIERKIIAEKYIQDSNGELNDYKFLCFNGKVYYCWIDIGRYSDRYRNIYDLDWNLQPWNISPYGNTPYKIERPENYQEMIKIAQKLCQGFSHVRVDFYNVDGKIYFGEMTFTTTGGFKSIVPEKYNNMLGDLWNLEKGNK